ncbi:capsular polysaccharide export protein, LipB/KpsS family [Rhizobium sp. CAU 1783]
MDKVEFIYSQRNVLKPLQRVLGERMDCAPFKLAEGLKELLRRKGPAGLIKLFSATATDIPLRDSIEHNFLRRQIRFPAVFGNPIAAVTYRALMTLRARLSAILIEARLEEHPDATALVFNGFMIPASLLAAGARQRGRSMLVMENGFFPNTSQCDRKGINFGSTLPRDAAFYLWAADRIGGELPQSLTRRDTKQKGEEAAALPGCYIFVPFQVPSDMQILEHSPWIRDMRHFYEVLFELAERYPEREFVIKEHPSFPLTIRDKVKAHPRIHFANHNETRKLIENAEAVITINSTVGMESLVLAKKVIVLGEAPYGIADLVLLAPSMPQLGRALEALDDWNPDERLRGLFLRYVYNVFLIPGKLEEIDPDMMEKVRMRAYGTDLHSRLVEEFAALSR